MAGVLERARKDLARGELWRARNRLEGFVGSRGYDRDVLELLGEVCRRMGDVPAAGRFWFFVAVDRPERLAAVETFVRQHGGGPRQIASALPRRLRAVKTGRLPYEARLRLEKLLAACAKATPASRRPRPPELRQAGFRLRLAEIPPFLVLTVLLLFLLYCVSLGLQQLFPAWFAAIPGR